MADGITTDNRTLRPGPCPAGLPKRAPETGDTGGKQARARGDPPAITTVACGFVGHIDPAFRPPPADRSDRPHVWPHVFRHRALDRPLMALDDITGGPR